MTCTNGQLSGGGLYLYASCTQVACSWVNTQMSCSGPVNAAGGMAGGFTAPPKGTCNPNSSPGRIGQDVMGGLGTINVVSTIYKCE